jgi:hypothetical protein
MPAFPATGRGNVPFSPDCWENSLQAWYNTNVPRQEKTEQTTPESQEKSMCIPLPSEAQNNKSLAVHFQINLQP